MQPFKKHPLISGLMALGLIFLVIGLYLKGSAETIVTPNVRLMLYCSLFVIGIAGYALFVTKKKVIFANLCLIFLLLLCLEVFCFFKLDKPAIVKKDFSLPDLSSDHIAMNVGSVPWADSVHHSVLVVENDTVYDVHYTIDHNNKRSTPGFDTTKTKHALFFGCSITFGEGVNDNQTMPYYFQENSECNSYNFALSGQGTNHTLARLQFDPLSKQVVEKDGIAIYVFYWDHLYRAIGTMNRYYDWLAHAPFYEMEGDSLVRNGLFKNGRYFTSKAYEYLHDLNTVKYFGLDFPIKLRDKDFELVAEMVLESKKEYQKQFGDNKFYCALYPDWAENPHPEQVMFIDVLRKKGIDIIDLTDFDYQTQHSLGKDGHPNPATHETLAKTLINRIHL